MKKFALLIMVFASLLTLTSCSSEEGTERTDDYGIELYFGELNDLKDNIVLLINNPNPFDIAIVAEKGMCAEDSYFNCNVSKNNSNYYKSDPTGLFSFEVVDTRNNETLQQFAFQGEAGKNYKWKVGDPVTAVTEVVKVKDPDNPGNPDNPGDGGTKGHGEVVFFTGANIWECKSVEVIVFRTLEEYYGTATTPGGGGIMGKKTFTGVFPDVSIVECGITGAATFSFPAGKYFYTYSNKDCVNGDKQYNYFYLTITEGECNKIWLSR